MIIQMGILEPFSYEKIYSKTYNFIFSTLIFSQSSEQIKQAKKFIQSSGMSESQARSLAKQQGYSDLNKC